MARRNRWAGDCRQDCALGCVNGDFLRTLSAQTNGITALAISPDGNTLAVTCQAPHTGGPGRIVKLWDVATDRIRQVLQPGTNVIEMTSPAFAPDGGVLATGEEDSAGEGEFSLWNVATGRLEKTIADPDPQVAVPISPEPLVTFSPDGKSLASVTMNQSVILWDPTTSRRQMCLRAETPPQPGRYAIRFTQQGLLLAHANRLNQVQVDFWNYHR